MPHFQPADALQAFHDFLQMRGQKLALLGVRDGLNAMLDFYADNRAIGCDFDDDADMLLFQWGTYDWGEGRHFALDLTRQLIQDEHGEDDGIWQLHLTFQFQPSPDLDGLGAGNSNWCQTLGELPALRDYVRQSSVVAAVADLPARVKLDYECAG